MVFRALTRGTSGSPAAGQHIHQRTFWWYFGYSPEKLDEILDTHRMNSWESRCWSGHSPEELLVVFRAHTGGTLGSISDTHRRNSW